MSPIPYRFGQKSCLLFDRPPRNQTYTKQIYTTKTDVKQAVSSSLYGNKSASFLDATVPTALDESRNPSVETHPHQHRIHLCPYIAEDMPMLLIDPLTHLFTIVPIPSEITVECNQVRYSVQRIFLVTCPRCRS